MSPLVLASTSEARQVLLKQAGLAFEAARPEVDEAALKTASLRGDPRMLASALAHAKAVSLRHRLPDALVIGADQVLNCDGEVLDKPETMTAARRQLERLRGREHWLETAVCCARNGVAMWSNLGRARLVMRPFSDGFLSDYLERVGAEALTSVGAYKLEGLGVQLFEAIEGDYFTILGLPLLPLLDFLRSEGAIGS